MGRDLEAALAALKKDWGFLSSRIRTAEHNVRTDHQNLNLRLHYPALRDARATVEELVDTIAQCLTHYSLPRKLIQDAYASWPTMATDFERHRAITRLEAEARSLFIRARKSSHRTGEAGELLLYLLTEWLLDAPQIIAKMSLKTSAQMPIHGSDGVHARLDKKSHRLILYSGEAKLHSDLDAAIRSAVDSIKAAVSHEKISHEIALVRRNIDFAGLDEQSRSSLLRYLDPFDEASNDRIEIVTCLIGFDFAAFNELTADGEHSADASFQSLATTKLRDAAPRVARALIAAGLAKQRIELFLFPVPSVAMLRDLFQDAIGWTKEENAGAR